MVFGKKNAIKNAIELASGDVILASDADCSFNPNGCKLWLTILLMRI